MNEDSTSKRHRINHKSRQTTNIINESARTQNRIEEEFRTQSNAIIDLISSHEFGKEEEGLRTEKAPLK
jgi:hypothetical protein